MCCTGIIPLRDWPFLSDASWKRRASTLFLVEEEIPELLSIRGKYRIKHDGHPTPETHRLLAEYVCREILGEP
jgi:hypothetical protein